MKARINGKTYNTETADYVCAWDNDRPRNDLHYEEVYLYRKRTGEFFIEGEGGAATVWGYEDKSGARSFGVKIFPVSKSGACQIAEARRKGNGVRFTSWLGFEGCSVEQEDNGGLEVSIGRTRFSAPAAENSGIRIG